MKKPIPFETLKLRSPRRISRKAKSRVIGHDTESLVSGFAFLVCDSNRRFKWIKSAEDVLDWLTLEDYSGAFNTFWNLDFDVTVLIKWLGEEFAQTLLRERGAWYQDVYFEYIPKRFLLVRRGVIWTTFYDASQFFVPRSLSGASKVYLGDDKIDVGSKEFNEAAYGNNFLVEYCCKDAELCQRLTEVLLKDLRCMGFSPTSLSSPGTVMEEVLVNKVRIPDITNIPEGALEYAYNAYRGGWMECFKRGYFPKLWDYDISSAYPYQVSQLVDLEGATYEYVDFVNGGTMPKGVEFGYAECIVNITADISPIIFRADVNTTPKGRWTTTITLDEIMFIRKNRLGTVKPLRGWFVMPASYSHRCFRSPMYQLFRQREVIQNKWLPKSMSVALYGKLAERDETGRIGNLFNPIYASAITARTRLQVGQAALVLPKNLVLITGDGISFDAPLPSTALSKGFGGLRLTYCDEAVVVGTNVCTIKGKYASGTWRPGKFNWLKLLRDCPDQLVFNLEHFRYVTLKEGVFKSGFEWDDVGTFRTFGYDFNLNFDRKRLYRKVKSAKELMSGQFECHAWEVGIPRRRKELWELQS